MALVSWVDLVIDRGGVNIVEVLEIGVFGCLASESLHELRGVFLTESGL